MNRQCTIGLSRRDLEGCHRRLPHCDLCRQSDRRHSTIMQSARSLLMLFIMTWATLVTTPARAADASADTDTWLAETAVVGVPPYRFGRVTRVNPGSAAEAAGVEEDDRYVAIDDVPVSSRRFNRERAALPGPTYVFTFYRPGSGRYTVSHDADRLGFNFARSSDFTNFWIGYAGVLCPGADVQRDVRIAIAGLCTGRFAAAETALARLERIADPSPRVAAGHALAGIIHHLATADVRICSDRIIEALPTLVAVNDPDLPQDELVSMLAAVHLAAGKASRALDLADEHPAAAAQIRDDSRRWSRDSDLVAPDPSVADAWPTIPNTTLMPEGHVDEPAFPRLRKGPIPQGPWAYIARWEAQVPRSFSISEDQDRRGLTTTWGWYGYEAAPGLRLGSVTRYPVMAHFLFQQPADEPAVFRLITTDDVTACWIGERLVGLTPAMRGGRALLNCSSDADWGTVTMRQPAPSAATTPETVSEADSQTASEQPTEKIDF